MEKIYDVIIVGGGPGGLTAGIYAKRAGLSTLLLEGAYINGGQVQNTYEVDNYPGLKGISGMDLSDKFDGHAKELGLEFAVAAVTGIEKKEGLFNLHTAKKVYFARTVILAAGARHRLLGVPGEEKFTGMGVSYCATCDGAFFKGKTTVVIGGGDVAAEDAIFLARGCEKVYLVHRRDALRAVSVTSDHLLSLPNVEVKWDSVAEEVLGKDGVEGLRIRNVKTGVREVLDANGIFVAVGIVPNTDFVKDLLALDAHGYIQAGEDTKTSVAGIYAVGDIRTKPLRQIVTAVADGANAITSIQEYLIEHSSL